MFPRKNNVPEERIRIVVLGASLTGKTTAIGCYTKEKGDGESSNDNSCAEANHVNTLHPHYRKEARGDPGNGVPSHVATGSIRTKGASRHVETTLETHLLARTVDTDECVVQITDVTCSSDYEMHRQVYMSEADGFIFMYDVMRSSTMDVLKKAISELCTVRKSPKKVPVLFVGTQLPGSVGSPRGARPSGTSNACVEGGPLNRIISADNRNKSNMEAEEVSDHALKKVLDKVADAPVSFREAEEGVRNFLKKMGIKKPGDPGTDSPTNGSPMRSLSAERRRASEEQGASRFLIFGRGRADNGSSSPMSMTRCACASLASNVSAALPLMVVDIGNQQHAEAVFCMAVRLVRRTRRGAKQKSVSKLLLAAAEASMSAAAASPRDTNSDLARGGRIGGSIRKSLTPIEPEEKVSSVRKQETTATAPPLVTDTAPPAKPKPQPQQKQPSPPTTAAPKHQFVNPNGGVDGSPQSFKAPPADEKLAGVTMKLRLHPSQSAAGGDRDSDTGAGEDGVFNDSFTHPRTGSSDGDIEGGLEVERTVANSVNRKVPEKESCALPVGSHHPSLFSIQSSTRNGLVGSSERHGLSDAESKEVDYTNRTFHTDRNDSDEMASSNSSSSRSSSVSSIESGQTASDEDSDDDEEEDMMAVLNGAKSRLRETDSAFDYAAVLRETGEDDYGSRAVELDDLNGLLGDVEKPVEEIMRQLVGEERLREIEREEKQRRELEEARKAAMQSDTASEAPQQEVHHHGVTKERADSKNKLNVPGKSLPQRPSTSNLPFAGDKSHTSKPATPKLSTVVPPPGRKPPPVPALDLNWVYQNEQPYYGKGCGPYSDPLLHKTPLIRMDEDWKARAATMPTTADSRLYADEDGDTTTRVDYHQYDETDDWMANQKKKSLLRRYCCQIM